MSNSELHELDDFSMPLGVLVLYLLQLIEVYGEDAVLYPDAGYSNVSLYLKEV